MINTTGVKVIDDHRTNIVKIIDNMYVVITSGKYEQSIIVNVLNQLLKESEIEFSLEEYFLERVHYPGVIEQKSNHFEIVTKIKMYINEFSVEVNDINKIKEVFSFLNEWYTKHMMEEDNKITHYLEIIKHIKQNRIDIFEIDIVNIIDDIYDKYTNNYFSKGI